MKKIFTLFSVMTTMGLISHSTLTSSFNYNQSNIITEDDINENEIKQLVVNYFKNVEKVNAIHKLSINDLQDKLIKILLWLFLANLIDEKEQILSCITTNPSEVNILDLDFKNLLLPLWLNLNDEKFLQLFAFSFIVSGNATVKLDDQLIELETKLFDLTFAPIKNEEDKKITLTIKKNTWENINEDSKLHIIFNFYKKMAKTNFKSENLTFKNDSQLNIDVNAMKNKFMTMINLFANSNFNFQNLQDMYHEIQFDEKTITIDFNE